MNNLSTIFLAFFMQQSFEFSKCQELIDKMDDNNFYVREKASRDILKVGRKALPAIVSATRKSESLEVRTRAQDAYYILIMPVVKEEMHKIKDYAVTFKLTHENYPCNPASGTIIYSNKNNSFILTTASSFDCYNYEFMGGCLKSKSHYNDINIIVLYNGKEYQGKVFKKHEKDDMAIVVIEKGDLPYPPMRLANHKSKVCLWGANSDAKLELVAGFYNKGLSQFIWDEPQMSRMYAGCGIFTFCDDFRFRFCGMILETDWRGTDEKVIVEPLSEIKQFISTLK